MMYNPLITNTCIYKMWTIAMLFTTVTEQNKILDWRICGLPTGEKLESLRSYSMHIGKFLFMSQVFYKEGQIIQGFYIEIGV